MMSNKYNMIVIAFLSLLLLHNSSGEAQDLFDGPESVLYDTVTDCWYVSNWAGGTVVRIDTGGDQSYFLTGRINCGGSEIVDNVFYTASAKNITGFDMTTLAQVFDLTIPTATLLNSICSDTSGFLYITDALPNKIYKIDLDGETYTTLNSSLNTPVGICYDPKNHRLLASSAAGSYYEIYSIDPSTGVKTLYATNSNGYIDGITCDELGNYYCTQSGGVFKYDSAFENPVPLSDGIFSWLGQPGCNREEGLLAFPDFNTNRLYFVSTKANFSADTVRGMVPFEVNFEGRPVVAIDSWSWDFGDGHSTTGIDPAHTYDIRGTYDITLEVTSGGKNYTITRENYICAIADSLVGSHVQAPLDSGFFFEVSISNELPLTRFQIPIEYPLDYSNLVDLKYLSYSVEGCRTAAFDSVYFLELKESKRRLTLNFVAGNAPPLAPGVGPVLKLEFTIQAGDNGSTITLEMDGYETYTPLFVSDAYEFEPVLVPGTVRLYNSCCIGTSGNVDCSEDETPDISDITRLIDYLYISHAALCCLEEADCNGSGDPEPDITDITALIDHLYISHQPLAVCP